MTNLLLLVLFIVVILTVSSKHINSKYSIDSLLHFYENVDSPSFLEPEGSSIVINHFDLTLVVINQSRSCILHLYSVTSKP